MATTIEQQVALDEALVPNLLSSRHSLLRQMYLNMQEFWAMANVHQHSIRFKMDTRKNIVYLESFRFLGHSAQIKTLTDVNVNKLFQPWRSFAAVINKCMTGKSTGFDSLRLTAAAKGKQPARATSPTDPSEIERTEAEQLKIVLRRSRQDTHISQHGGSSTDEGTDVNDQTKGRDDNEGEKTNESDDDDDQDEAEKDNDDDDDEEEISKIDEQEATESGEGDDEETESDGESKEEETREEAEESFDLIPKTPEDSEDTGNGEEDQGLRISEEERMQEEEEADELYRDVNINQGRGLQVSQDIDDSHVTLTPVHSDIQESSSTSSFMTSLLIPIIDPGNKSTQQSDEQRNLYKALVEAYEADKTILDSYGESAILKRRRKDDDDQEGPSARSDRGSKRRREDTLIDFSNFIMNRLGVDTLTPELLAGPTYELMKGSCNSLTELEYHLEEVYKATTDQLDWVYLEDQQYPHNLLQPLPLIPDNRGRRVIPFEHFINNDLEYLRGGASSRKYITSVTKTKVADYGHIKWIEDLVPRTMWMQEPLNCDKHPLWGVSHWGRKHQQFYGFAINRESALDVYSKRRIIATKGDKDRAAAMIQAIDKMLKTRRIMRSLERIEESVNAQLEAEVLTRSSYSSRTSYAVAADLLEMELKKILIDKMEGNKESAILKRRREDDDDQEGPSAGLDWGSKRQREGGEHASASTPFEPATRSAGRSTKGTQSRQMSASESAFPRKPPTPDHDWNKTLPAVQGNAQSWISGLAKQNDARSSFNKLLDTPIDFSNFIMNRLGVDTLTPKLLAGPTYKLTRGSCNSLTKLEYHLEEVYKATTDQLD
nr:hypothetical protein [Tanacetum cinerariifolium]